MVTAASMKASPYFSEYIAYHAFIGNYVLTVIVATIATLAFESPIVIIEKVIFGSKKKSNVETINETNRTQITRREDIANHAE